MTLIVLLRVCWTVSLFQHSLKLHLKSPKNGGKLQLDENIPLHSTDDQPLHPSAVGTVERALGIFSSWGLWSSYTAACLMTDIELMIGQITEAESKNGRQGCKQRPCHQFPDKRRTFHPIRPPEIEIKKEIDRDRKRYIRNGQASPAAMADTTMFFLPIRNWTSGKF